MNQCGTGHSSRYFQRPRAQFGSLLQIDNLLLQHFSKALFAAAAIPITLPIANYLVSELKSDKERGDLPCQTARA